LKENAPSPLELKVAQADIGKIIGKQGRTAGELRTILSTVSARQRNEQSSINLLAQALNTSN
jgi:predicted RNA-binding protein YlqC (UPF0109 family)